MCDPGDKNEMACEHSGQDKCGCVRSRAAHLGRAGLMQKARAPVRPSVCPPSCGLGSLPPLSCAAMVGMVRHGHYHFKRSHWEALELGGSFGRRIVPGIPEP